MAKKKATGRRRGRPPKKATTAAAQTNGHVMDGTIELEVQGGPHDGQRIVMDPMLVKLAAESLVTKHKLPIDGGLIQATADFARDLDLALQELGYKSTPAIAIHAWVRVSEYFAELQKKTS